MSWSVIGLVGMGAVGGLIAGFLVLAALGALDKWASRE